MNKLNDEHQKLIFSSAPRSDVEPARRLIVLVPGLGADAAVVTRRIWELANATGSHVQFIGLYDDAMQEPGLRRELVTMSALVSYDNVSADAEVLFGKDWAEAVRSRWQAGDLVVYLDEYRAGVSRKPLGQILQLDLDMPLYILSGLYSQSAALPSWLTQAAAWSGFVAIILGFCLLQIKSIHLAEGWSTALLLLSIPVEYWLIWAWNSLFG